MLELTIEKLTHGGRGMGRHDGKAVFVPLTCPGDRVRCRVNRDRGRYAEAELVEVLVPATGRREPPCPLFGDCGGCQWQHLPYALQCTWKERIFRELLVRKGVIEDQDIEETQAAAEEFFYRSRAQFKCRLTPHGPVMGFYRGGSHFVVDVERCLLVEPPVQQVLTRLRQAVVDAPAADAIPQIDVSCGENRQVRVVLHALPAAADRLQPWLRTLAEASGFSAFLQSGRKEALRQVWGEPGLTQRVGPDPVNLVSGPGCFTQVNRAQNNRLVEAVLEAADLQGSESVLDLFCGIGNFSLPLARRAAEVVGIEDYAPAISDARRNADRNGLDNVRFVAEDARIGLQRRHQPGSCDLVVLDPPRSGCYAVIKELLPFAPRRIIYVSCDPATLARDLQLLVHNGYRAVHSRPVDLFPQTWHIESLTLLERLS